MVDVSNPTNLSYSFTPIGPISTSSSIGALAFFNDYIIVSEDQLGNPATFVVGPIGPNRMDANSSFTKL